MTTVAIINYPLARVEWVQYIIQPEPSEIASDIADMYDLNDISWSVVNSTCKSCKFWKVDMNYCVKGVQGIETEFKEFGCNLHKLKD